MKTRHQWVLYRVVGNKKVPYQPNGKCASVTNPKTWNSFEKVVAAYNAGGFDRPGFVFTPDDPFCGVDVDDGRNPPRVRSSPGRGRSSTRSRRSPR